MDSQTEKPNLRLPKGKGLGGLNWELGIKRHTLLYTKLKAGGERDHKGWVMMASLTQWTWVWANSGRWWRTGRPGMLQSMGLQRAGHDWDTEQQLHKTDSKQGPTVYLTELCSVSCNNLWWRRIWKRNIYVCFCIFSLLWLNLFFATWARSKGDQSFSTDQKQGTWGCVCVYERYVCVSVCS